jgi:hypothetical protein
VTIVIYKGSKYFGDLTETFGDLTEAFGDLTEMFGDLTETFGDLTDLWFFVLMTLQILLTFDVLFV